MNQLNSWRDNHQQQASKGLNWLNYQQLGCNMMNTGGTSYRFGLISIGEGMIFAVI